MKSASRLAVFLLLAICMQFGAVKAADNLGERTDPAVIRIGFSEYPPVRMGDRPGTECGIETELLRELCRRMGLRPEFVHAPFVRNLKSMEDGYIDLMIGVLRRPQREQYMHFVEPAYVDDVRYIFCLRKGNEGRLQSYEDLRGMTIGITNGAKYFPQFDDDDSLTKDEVRTVYQNVEKLLKGRIDVFIGEECMVKYILRRKGLQNVIAMAPYRFSLPQQVFITLSRQSQFFPRADEFSRHIKAMKADGAMRKFSEDFFDSLSVSSH
ncbi:MAG: substrate-binding periplasmic protein [Halodesulfovibrio sp.]